MSKRDPWLDNAKFWLVALVVVGHSLVLAPVSDLRAHTYDFVYTFHMPAFVLVSGYLSRRFRWTKRHLVALVTTLLVPYMIFELVISLYRVYVAGSVSSMDALTPLWLEPHWPMWFLLVLAMWRLATPVLISHWSMVLWAIAASLLAGHFDMELLDLNRFFGLLPYFVIGLHLPAAVLAVTRRRWTPLVGLPVLVWLWFVAESTDQRWSTEWFYFRSAYDVLGVSLSEGIEIRAQLIVLGLIGTFAFLTLVPRKESVFTAMGAASMVVYLFHGFVVQWGDGHDWQDAMVQDEFGSVALVVVCAVALAALLGWKPVSDHLSVLADPWNQALVPLLARRAARRGAPLGPAQPGPPDQQRQQPGAESSGPS